MIIATYGSLKKGFYNHRALGDAEFLGTDTVRGVMYWNGSYPKLYQSSSLEELFIEDLARDHEIEVYRITPEAYRLIYGMEIGAGYGVGDVETKYGVAKIFWMPYDEFRDEDRWLEKYTLEVIHRSYGLSR